MHKGEYGYEHDFRAVGRPRWHVRYGTNRKDAAERLHDVARQLWRSREEAVIAAVREGRVTIEQLAELRSRGQAFGTVLEVAGHPWPTLQEAVDTYVAWLEANPNKAAGTVRAAKTTLRKAVAKFGAGVRLDEITAKQVTEWQQQLAATHATNYVTATVWKLGTLYRWHISREAIAAREGRRAPRPLWVPFNPDEISHAKTRRERFLSESEAARLLEAAPVQFRLPIACGLFAGLRVEEMLRLRTAFDVDLERGILRVQPQPGWKPKTGRSVRVVPISPALRAHLEPHLRSVSTAEWVTPAWKDTSLPFNRHTFETHFRRVVEGAGLVAGRKDRAGVTFHTLRHTFASWLLMRGVDMYTVAQLLGDTVKMVEDTYGHLSQDHTAEAVGRLTIPMGGAKK